MCLNVNRRETLALLSELQQAGSEGMVFWKGVRPEYSKDGTKLMSPIRRDFEWMPGLIKSQDREGGLPAVRVFEDYRGESSEIVEGGALHVYRHKANAPSYWGLPLKVWGRYDDFVAANHQEACFTALWITAEDWDNTVTAGQKRAIEDEMRRVQQMRMKNKQKLWKALSNKVHGTKFKV